MRKKIEIMYIEQGKLCVKNVKLCATFCANINKKELSPCISPTFLLKKVNIKKVVDHLLKVHILTEYYIPLYSSYLHFINTTHHYSLKFYNHT